MFQSAHGFELLRDSFDALGDAGPIIVFTLAQHHPIKGQAPGLFRRMRETQTLKGNGKPDDVTVWRQAPLIIPNRVKTEIVGLALGVYGIGLNAEWIRIEYIGAVVIAKGVQQNADAIILIHVFAF